MQVRASFGATIAATDHTTPGEIVYIPEGTHHICPTVDGKPQRIIVKMTAAAGPAVADRFQQELDERLANNVRPHLDFDHAGRGPAAGIPTAFRYQPGTGLMLAVDWTDKGRTAIRGRDYSYFSPEFLLDDDSAPAGLAPHGAIGALTNEPAFRDIPRIAASDRSRAASEPHNPTEQEDMNPLVQCGLLTPQEAALSDAPETARKRVQVMKDKLDTADDDASSKDDRIAQLEAELKALKAEKDKADRNAKQSAESRADQLVQTAVSDGRIAPGDETTQRKFRSQIAAGNAMAEEYLASLAQRPDPSRPVIRATSGMVRTQADEATGLARVTAALAAEQTNH
ncbi:MAG: phage protease [Luteolibacter sp.]